MLLEAHLERVGKGSAVRRERPQEERFLHADSVVSHAGCVAVHGRSDFHAGSVAGKGVAGGREHGRYREDTGVWWMMTWRDGV